MTTTSEDDMPDWMRPTDERLAHARATDNPLADIVHVMGEQIQHLSALVTELQEREQWYLRQRIASDEQRLAVLRQVTVPTLLERIREEGA